MDNEEREIAVEVGSGLEAKVKSIIYTNITAALNEISTLFSHEEIDKKAKIKLRKADPEPQYLHNGHYWWVISWDSGGNFVGLYRCNSLTHARMEAYNEISRGNRPRIEQGEPMK